MSINYSGIDSLLKGSIALIADKSSKNSKKSFKLYKSYQEAYKIKN